MSSTNTTFIQNLFNNTPLTAGQQIESEILNLDDLKPAGFFSLQYAASGTGTVTYNYLLSNDGKTFAPEDSVTEIVKDVSASNGFAWFAPAVAKFMKISAKESSLTASALATATICIQ